MGQYRGLGVYMQSDNPGHRRVRRYTDQHGRLWWCNYDKRAGGPVGPIEPDGWSAPFMPPQKYLLPDDDDNSMTIDYESMLVDLRRARREWVAELTRWAIELNLTPPKHDKDKIEPKLLEKVGPAPGSLVPWQACRAGNRFALGFDDTIDVRLKPFLPLPPERVQVIEEDGEDWATPKVAAAGR